MTAEEEDGEQKLRQRRSPNVLLSLRLTIWRRKLELRIQKRTLQKKQVAKRWQCKRKLMWKTFEKYHKEDVAVILGDS